MSMVIQNTFSLGHRKLMLPDQVIAARTGLNIKTGRVLWPPDLIYSWPPYTLFPTVKR